MNEPTQAQQSAADFVAAWYGRSAVEPSYLADYTGNIVVIGLTDDIERSCWMIRPDGAVSNVAWSDDALTEYLKTIPPQRTPMLVPRAVQTGGLAAMR